MMIMLYRLLSNFRHIIIVVIILLLYDGDIDI